LLLWHHYSSILCQKNRLIAYIYSANVQFFEQGILFALEAFIGKAPTISYTVHQTTLMQHPMPDTDTSLPTPTQVYETLREGMLSDTEDWKQLISDEVTIVGPLVRLKGKANFIKIHESWFQSVERNIVHKLVEHNDFVITQISTTIETSNQESITLELSEWYTIRNGKIEALEVYFDASALRAMDRNRYEAS